jgi:CHAD domain-containing protein
VILRDLLRTMLANEEGTRQDLDSEFLHDFRVAVRRTRSALSQVKGVLPPDDVEPFRRELSWLGSATGPTRDMDVYLLKMPDYESSLPRAVRRDLEPLKVFLERHQRLEQRRLAKTLAAARYQRLVREWDAFLERSAPSEPPPHAARPIVEVASERIWKTWRKVAKAGRAISPETPAEALHRLRIACKKLRYLLEFFRGLYPAKKIGPLVKSLKQLQDNLGDFNDYEVQQGALAGFARQMRDEGDTPVETLMAIGRLVDHLESGQAEERRKFAERFALFDAEANRRLFRRLFAPQGGKR